MGISKSRYVKYCQCPKMLWLSINKPELAEMPAGLDERFDTGHQVGNYAKGLFGPYEDMSTFYENQPDRVNIDAQIAKTKDAVNRGVENIAEASFAYDGNYCAVDILRKTPDGYEIYEVKSVSYKEGDVKQLKKHIETYLPDISYQYWVMSKQPLKITGVYLVCLNGNYVRGDELDIKQLFTTIDFTDYITPAVLSMITDAIEPIEKLQKMTDEPEQDLHLKCKKPYDCLWMKYCMKEHGIKYPSVFNLYRAQWKKKLEYYSKGIISYKDVQPLVKSDTQVMQVACTLSGEDHIDYAGIGRFLSTVRYPLYFLDFETFQDAIPRYKGISPYQQVPFQYSLHIKESVDSPLRHTEFLGYPGTDPRRALAEKLCNDIPEGACSIAYNMQFEKGRIKEMAIMFPDLEQHLLSIHDNMIDLMEPFQGCCYYTPAMRDSFSIKSVLPALFPDSEELNYHNLNESVQNGSQAMNMFPRMATMNEAEVSVARKALLDYCCLDTLAMVRVLEKLYQVARENDG